jgi:hypothetical protein
LRRSLSAGIDRFLMLFPLTFTAAYDEPPRAMNTATVDMAFA